MTKTETFCDICGKKVSEPTLMIIHEWERHEMDLCKACTIWLLDLISYRQTEMSATP